MVAKLKIVLEVRWLAAHATDVAATVFKHIGPMVFRGLQRAWETSGLSVG